MLRTMMKSQDPPRDGDAGRPALRRLGHGRRGPARRGGPAARRAGRTSSTSPTARASRPTRSPGAARLRRHRHQRRRRAPGAPRRPRHPHRVRRSATTRRRARCEPRVVLVDADNRIVELGARPGRASRTDWTAAAVRGDCRRRVSPRRRSPTRLPRGWPRPSRAGPSRPTSSSSASGIAGLTAALRARTRARLPRPARHQGHRSTSGSTPWAQGGIAAALGPARHARPAPAATPSSPASACATRRAVRVLVTEGPRRGPRADRAAAPSSTATPTASCSLTREGGHHRRPHRARGRRRDRCRGLARARRAPSRATRASRSSRTRSSLDLLLDDRTAAAVRRDAARHRRGPARRRRRGPRRARSCSRPAASARCSRRRPTPRCRPATGSRSRCAPGRRSPTWSSCSSTRRCSGSAPASTGQQPLVSEAVRGEGALLLDADGVRFMADVAPAGRARPARRRGARRSCARMTRDRAPTTSGSTPGTSARRCCARASRRSSSALPSSTASTRSPT